MAKLFVSFLFMFCVEFISAQNKFTFSSQNYAGLVTGNTGSDPIVQTINGFKKGKWFAGIGTGIDWYYQRSIPLFASVNRDIFSKGRRSLFLSGNAGINFSWRNNEGFYSNHWGSSKQTNGLYWSGGAGYRLGVGKADNALLFQIGYSFKQMGEKITNTFPCLIPPCPENTESYDYRLKTITFKLGWGF